MQKSGRDRIIEEFNDLSKNPIAIPNKGLTVELFDNNDPTKWRVTIVGPKDTPYEGGFFNLLVAFPPNYPQKPPEVYFLTPIYHANINHRAPSSPGSQQLGHVNISILNWWQPEYRMRELFTNIFALFYMANPTRPHCADESDKIKELSFNRELYEKKVKYFTQKYANPSNKGYKRDKDWNFDYPNNA